MTSRKQFQEKAAAHWEARVNSAELKEVWVEELGISIFYRPYLSLMRKDRVMRENEKGGLDWLVQLIIEAACDEDGKHLFNQNDKDWFRKNMDPDLIIRIANEMSSSLGGDPEEEVKKHTGNSEKTETSGTD